MRTLSTRSRLFNVALSAMVAAIVLFALFEAAPAVRAKSNSIVISQVYGGGGNSGATYTNDFVELFNLGSTPVSVEGWTVQYASSTGTTWQKTVLSGTIQPGQYYLVQEAKGNGGSVPLPTPDATGTIAMGAAAGKVALVGNSTTLVGTCPSGVIDLVGFGPATNCSEGSPTAALSNTTAAIRAASGCTDNDVNLADFAVGAPAPRNTASAVFVCPLPSDPSGTGTAEPAWGEVGGTVLLTVAVRPGSNPPSTGLTVSGDLTTIGGAAAESFADDGTGGDQASGDLTFSLRATIADSTATGQKTVPVTIGDAQGRLARASIALTVVPPLTAIHDIQGASLRSTHVGEPVHTRGIITAFKSNGFFLQAPDAEADLDPATSEGIFVFTSSAPPASLVRGAEVEVVGSVQEYGPGGDASHPATEIVEPSFSILATGQPLPTPQAVTAADTSATGGPDQLERFEGMLVHIDAARAVSGSGGKLTEKSATSVGNGSFYAVIDPVARPFREPGIDVFDPDASLAPPGVVSFDGNPERLLIESGAPGGGSLVVSTGAVVTDITGPVDVVAGGYGVVADAGAIKVSGGLAAAVPVPAPAANEFTVASFNLQRFYDDTKGSGDVELDADAYQRRLQKALLSIRDVLHLPDVIGVEEVENLATLTAIADKVNADAASGSPAYAAFVEPGNDPSAINVGFLVKTSRVSVTSVTQLGREVTFIDPRNQTTPMTLNDRPPLFLEANVQPPGRRLPYPITVVVNHLRSLTSIGSAADGPFVRGKRLAQAQFLAEQVSLRPAERVIAVGDFNAFQVNDGYVDVMGVVRGQLEPGAIDYLVPDHLFATNLTDLVETLPPTEQYSYVENGTAQVLDHVLVNGNIHASRFAYARANADFPEVWRNDASRPERLSDHDMPVAYFEIPPEADLGLTMAGLPVSAVAGRTFSGTLTLVNLGPDPALKPFVRLSVPALVGVDSLQAPGWACTNESTGVYACRAETLAPGATVQFPVTLHAACDAPDGSSATIAASAGATSGDPETADNSASSSLAIANPVPTIGPVAVDRAVIWPPNHLLVDVTVSYETTDKDSCSMATTSLSVSSSEPADGLGDGDTSPDYEVVDAHHVRLRAERSGAGPGRVYTITVKATDAAGGSSTRTSAVVVPKSSGK